MLLPLVSNVKFQVFWDVQGCW